MPEAKAMISNAPIRGARSGKGSARLSIAWQRIGKARMSAARELQGMERRRNGTSMQWN